MPADSADLQPAAHAARCGSSSRGSSSGGARRSCCCCCSCCRSSSRWRSRSADRSTENDAGALVSLATVGATNFALFTEFAAVGFLLVVVVSLFCGDTVASEASWASLRYLLAQPVPRSRLLRQKFIVAGVAVGRGQRAAAAVGVSRRRAVLRLGAGALAARRHVRHRAGSLWRLLIIVALRLRPDCSSSPRWRSCSACSVDNPLGAVGGAVMLVVVSNDHRPDHGARPVPALPAHALQLRVDGRAEQADQLGRHGCAAPAWR